MFPKFDPTRHTIKLLEKGVDPYLYHRFKNLTPKIGEDESTKELKIEWDKWYGHRGNWNRENCLFCFDFLIDAILKFQGEEYQGYQMIAYSDLFVDMIEAKDDVVVKVYNSKGPSLEETFELKRGQTLEGFVCDYSESDKSVLVFSASLPFSHIGVIEKSKVKITSIEKK